MFKHRTHLYHILSLPLTSSVTLGKLPYLSVPLSKISKVGVVMSLLHSFYED